MDNETNVVHEFPSDAMSVEEATAIENQENMVTAEESAEAAADVAAEIPAETENTQETPKEPISKMKAHSIGYAAGVGVLLILVFIRLIVMDNHVNKLET